jgi:hypothetical protein
VFGSSQVLLRKEWFYFCLKSITEFSNSCIQMPEKLGTKISLEIDCIWMEEERDDLYNYMLELVDLILEYQQGVRSDWLWTWTLQNEESREKERSSIEIEKALLEGDRPVTTTLKSSEFEVGLMFKSIAGASAFRKEIKSLVVLQFNWRKFNNKSLEFWNLFDRYYNSEVVIGTEWWVKKDIRIAEAFRSDFTSFRRNKSARGGGIFYVC